VVIAPFYEPSVAKGERGKKNPLFDRNKKLKTKYKGIFVTIEIRGSCLWR
jgi:hypothetical protein